MNLRVILILFLVLAKTVSGQITLRPYKTFRDSVFEVGDIIKCPVKMFHSWRDFPPSDSVLIIANFLNANPKMHVELSVHTCYRGSIEYNDTVSFRAAQSLVDVLVSEYGVNGDRLQYWGYGERFLIIPEFIVDMFEEKTIKEYLISLNRRVVLKVLKIE